MVERVGYNDLNMKAKLNCIREFCESICPYEDYDEQTIGDIEYSVMQTLETMHYTIDKCGYWYNGIGEKC